MEDTEQRTVYIKFGPGETDEIRAAGASKMLTILKDDHPQIFGQVLAKSLGIELNGRRRSG